ncbi:hypothetical protein [Stenotrophomonas riyadhensis]
MKQLVQRLGHAEAPAVAGWFLTVNERYVVQNMHDLGSLLSKCEAFGPLSQDKGCIRLIQGRGALASVQAGHIHHAIALCSKEWASLPGAGYGQHEHKFADLLAVYCKAGGTVAP